jgi:hypothetical protein
VSTQKNTVNDDIDDINVFDDSKETEVTNLLILQTMQNTPIVDGGVDETPPNQQLLHHNSDDEENVDDDGEEWDNDNIIDVNDNDDIIDDDDDPYFNADDGDDDIEHINSRRHNNNNEITLETLRDNMVADNTSKAYIGDIATLLM